MSFEIECPICRSKPDRLSPSTTVRSGVAGRHLKKPPVFPASSPIRIALPKEGRTRMPMDFYVNISQRKPISVQYPMKNWRLSNTASIPDREKDSVGERH